MNKIDTCRKNLRLLCNHLASTRRDWRIVYGVKKAALCTMAARNATNGKATELHVIEIIRVKMLQLALANRVSARCSIRHLSLCSIHSPHSTLFTIDELLCGILVRELKHDGSPGSRYRCGYRCRYRYTNTLRNIHPIII